MSDAPTRRSKQGMPLTLGLAGGVIGSMLGFTILGSGFLGWYVTGHEQARLSAWIAGTMTILVLVTVALFVAYVALVTINKRRRMLLLRHAVDLHVETRAHKERASKEQAAAVAGWYATDTGDLAGAPGVRLRNASSVPVTQVRLLAQHDDVVIGRLDVPVLPPNSEPVFVGFPDDAVQQIRAIQGGTGGQNQAGQPKIDMLFCDAAGVPWHRAWRGTLTELKPAAPGS